MKNILTALAVLAASALAAQEATELFIPLGRSPDLSETVTVMGTIESVDAENREIVVRTDGGTATAAVTERTWIFLDKTKLRQANEYGKFADLRAGRRIEVLYEGRDRRSQGPAKWVKVEIEP